MIELRSFFSLSTKKLHRENFFILFNFMLIDYYPDKDKGVECTLCTRRPSFFIIDYFYEIESLIN